MSAGREALKSVGRRLALAAASGLLVGAYIALEFFPGQPPLQVQHPAPLATGLQVYNHTI